MNRHAIKWAILGATLIALMGPTGGFPSRPTFQSVTVNGNTTTGSLTTAGATSLQALTATNLSLSGTGSLLQVGSAKSPWWPSITAVDIGNMGSLRTDSGGTFGFSQNIYYDGTNWRYKSASALAAAEFTASLGSFTWSTAPSGAAGAPATLTQVMSLSNVGVLNVRGVDVPKVSYATCAGAGGFTAGFQVSNVASCINDAVGQSHITFISAYANGPTCTATIDNGPGATAIAATNTTSVYVKTYNTTFAAATQAFSIICTGT